MFRAYFYTIYSSAMDNTVFLVWSLHSHTLRKETIANFPSRAHHARAAQRQKGQQHDKRRVLTKYLNSPSGFLS